MKVKYSKELEIIAAHLSSIRSSLMTMEASMEDDDSVELIDFSIVRVMKTMVEGLDDMASQLNGHIKGIK